MSDEPLPPIPMEETHLALHVQMCRQRHDTINRRLRRIEYIGAAILLAVVTGGGLTVEKMRAILDAVSVVADHQPGPANAPGNAWASTPRR